MKILVINAGSSSLKYQLFNMEHQEVLAKGLCERIGIEGSRLKHHPEHKNEVIIERAMKDHNEAIAMVLAALTDEKHGVIASMDEINAVGHRVVHGGEFFQTSVVIDEAVKKAIESCIELAPLHNPPNLMGIAACEKAMPGCRQVAVFDTAFHQTMPAEAYMYAIPMEYYKKYKIRKYGFHGTSHKYVAQRAAAMLGKPLDQVNLITLHLGNGSSITAVKQGKSVDTSMGFTPLAGVPMGTRSGDIDPAILTFLAEKEDLTAAQVSNILNKDSGVLGISELSSDFRDLAQAREEGQQNAILAEDMFVYSCKKYIGAYAGIMGSVDAIIFTAGVGENNTTLRAKMLAGLEHYGVIVDLEKNEQRGQELDVSGPGATVKTLVIPTNEELMIARETVELL